MPSRGDLAPSWSALAADGTAQMPETYPGRPLLLCFLCRPEGAEAFLSELSLRAVEAVSAGCPVLAFVRTRADGVAQRSFSVLLDEDASLARAFCLPLSDRTGAEPAPRAVVIDAGGRVLATAPLELSDKGAAAAVALAQRESPFDALLCQTAPVLHLPELLSKELCDELIRAFRAGPSVEGTVVKMRDGKAEHSVMPEHKQRRDLRLVQPLKDKVWEQLWHRLVPAARKAFHFRISRFEYLQIGRYGAEEAGHFNAHRDDDQSGCSHRQFALTVNLNEEYQGGELVFHESGEVARPAAGGAVLFSCSLLHEAKVVTRGERFVLVGMFWGEDQVAQFERNTAPPAQGPAFAPRAIRKSRIAESARAMRELAGDLESLSAHLDGPPGQRLEVDLRVARLSRELFTLRDDLRGLRKPYLDEQLKKLPAPALAAPLRLHLGCAGHRLPGWVNIDASGGDLAMDLRWPLPFGAASAEYAFASHVLEHLYRFGELPALLREIHRVLRPGGVLRAVVPDLEKCLRAYASGDAQFFEDRKKTWAWAKSCKTPLDHFLAYAGANQALEGFEGHKYGYDLPTLSLALREAGFATVVQSSFMQSPHPPLRIDDKSYNATASSNGVHYSLFVEAVK